MGNNAGNEMQNTCIYTHSNRRRRRRARERDIRTEERRRRGRRQRFPGGGPSSSPPSFQPTLEYADGFHGIIKMFVDVGGGWGRRKRERDESGLGGISKLVHKQLGGGRKI